METTNNPGTVTLIIPDQKKKKSALRRTFEFHANIMHI